ncbi:lipase member H-like [Trichoplusia ni]|uniref:Lipase member H-like n=1 Tax=Trichoplusia ni TaxID=7111 RepID=A0A7E5VWW7_TRINI|nr:lipase member H-like [Trichoplusia ni]
MISYPYVSLKALAMGRDFGVLIVKLSDAGMNIATLQLIGFSLGAHVVGETGRQVIESGKIIPRITGLDPAKPLFDGPIPSPLYKRLERGCADFVDIIHSNPKKYGMETATGTIDFYPNYGETVQPGCPEGNFMPFTPEELCSHDRSRELMIQALFTPYDLQASAAPNYPTWVRNNGAPINVTTIGDLINKAFSGLYYLTTNAQVPYGKGPEGLKP